MDFQTVVQKAKDLHCEGSKPLQQEATSPVACEEVYGRVCNTVGSSPPLRLATSHTRKTVFIFGPDSINSIILKHNTYDTLLRLGFDKQYIYHEVVEKKYTFWLVLFKVNTVQTEDRRKDFFVVPATWDGIIQVVRTSYPDAYEDILHHLDELKLRTVEDFEKMAGFEFLSAKKNEEGTDPNAPPFYSYDYYCSLPRPRSAWQVRLFLYCEMRLLKLFNGDGYTLTETGSHGSLEYLCPNVSLSNFDPTKAAVIPMVVNIPES